MENNKGQVTIFIILGIVIVVSVVLALWFFGGVDLGIKEDLEPRQFVDKCVREAVEPSINLVLANGGRINPEIFKLYQDEEYNYLCYQKNYYLTCVNSHPQLKQIVEEGIVEDSRGRVEECFVLLKQDAENKGYDYSGGEIDYSVELAPREVSIKVTSDISLSSGENSESFKEFDTRILSPLYELIMIAREIVNQESQFCNFEYNGFMLLYPEYDIKRISYDDSRIYKITDRKTGNLFKFAVRSCVLPAGI